MGKPSLQARLADKYDESYSDRGTGCKQDLSVWKPRLLEGEFRIVYSASNSRTAPKAFVPVVKDVSAAKGSTPALAKPTHFKCVWNDKGTGGNKDGQLWEAVPPSGYVALGHVAVHCKQTSPGDRLSAHEVDPDFRCVHKDLVDVTELGEICWKDSGSGGRYDGSVWNIPSTHAFISAGSYSRPPNTQHKLSIITQPILLDMVCVHAMDNITDHDQPATTYTLTSSVSIEHSESRSRSNEISTELAAKVTAGGEIYGGTAEMQTTLGTKSATEYMAGTTAASTTGRSVSVPMNLPAKTRVQLWQMVEHFHGGSGAITMETTHYEIRESPL